MLVDSHCHLDDPRFDPDRDAVWARAHAAGVSTVVIPGVEPGSWARTVSVATHGAWPLALGIHPQCLPDLPDATVTAGLSRLTDLCRTHGAVAVGECGFDGTVDRSLADGARQRRVFMAHVEIARALDLPLVVHVFRAHGEALDALRAVTLPRTPGVIHSCSASVDVARGYLSLGFHLGFAGAVTRPTARRLLDTVRTVPSHRVLLESDAPDQTPTGVPRGDNNAPARCEPAHVTVTLARLAQVRGVSVETLARETADNARELFRLRAIGGDSPQGGT